jgi:hypothetical protein
MVHFAYKRKLRRLEAAADGGDNFVALRLSGSAGVHSFHVRVRGYGIATIAKWNALRKF